MQRPPDMSLKEQSPLTVVAISMLLVDAKKHGFDEARHHLR
jgi:hypothetical protein